MDYGFEFTQLNDPTWSNASASGNDVQRLTHGTTPFGAGATPANLTAANVLNIYFNLALLTSGDVFRGGFFTDLNNDFTTAVGSATYNFFVLGDGNGTDATFNSVSYYSLANYDPNASINQTVVQVPSANFSGGTVLNGWVQQFEVTIIPEPSGIFLILCGALTMGWYYRRQRSV